MNVQISIADIFKTPVFALHASASGGSQWDRLVQDLAGRFDVIAPELPDLPHVETVEDDGNLGDLARPIIDRIAAFGQPVHLVGHSLGAAVAMRIALLRPDLVKSLTLYEPTVFHLLDTDVPEERTQIAELHQTMQTLAESTVRGSAETGMCAFVDFWNGSGTWDRVDDNERKRLIDAIPTFLRDYARCDGERWPIEDFGRLNIPVLVLMGMDSAEASQAIATKIANAVPHARLAMLPGASHMAPVFESRWVNPRITEHLVSVERPPANCLWPQKTAA